MQTEVSGTQKNGSVASEKFGVEGTASLIGLRRGRNTQAAEGVPLLIGVSQITSSDVNATRPQIHSMDINRVVAFRKISSIMRQPHHKENKNQLCIFVISRFSLSDIQNISTANKAR